ncbi:hypothetical protein ACFL6S_18595 [Candidatus Poribacteria bacterium]
MRRLEVVLLILAACVILAVVSGNVVGTNDNEGYTKDGSSVYWEVDNIGRMVVYPHTTYGSRHCYQINITSYLTSQELDFAFEFDRGIHNKEVYMWKNYTHNVTIYEYSNQTVEKCSTDNETNETSCWNETEQMENVSHYELQNFHDWYSIKNKFSTTVRNNHDWHFIKNTYWNENQARRLKFCFDSPVSVKSTKAKWHLFAKRSSDTLEEAIADNKYIKLDPWYTYGLNTGLVSYWSFNSNADDALGNYDGIPSGT